MQVINRVHGKVGLEETRKVTLYCFKILICIFLLKIRSFSAISKLWGIVVLMASYVKHEKLNKSLLKLYQMINNLMDELYKV